MNEKNRFFVIINRINSLLLLVVFLLVAGGLILTFFMGSQWRRNRTIEVQDKSEQGKTEKVKLSLGHIEQVHGAPIQLVRLETEAKGGKFSSSGYQDRTRNVMFLTKDLKQARWLFPKHHFVIKAIDQLREKKGYEKKDPTSALYYEVIKEDSNGDGRLSEDDNSVVAISKIDGSGYVEIISGLQRTLGHQIVNQGTELAVLIEKDGRVLYMTYSLQNFTKTSEILIAEITDKL